MKLTAVLSTSLWGRELKDHDVARQEIVAASTSLWGRELKAVMVVDGVISSVSTSLWGRELKDHLSLLLLLPDTVDLLVRSWVERLPVHSDFSSHFVDLLVRSWVERYPLASRIFFDEVDLLVRSWVERMITKQSISTVASTSLWGRELKEICVGRYPY